MKEYIKINKITVAMIYTFVAVVIAILIPKTALAYNSNEYDKGEVQKLLSFAANAGNEETLGWNVAIDIADWKGVVWEKDEDDIYYVKEIIIPDLYLSGILDISGFKHLVKLDCSGNSLTGLNISGDSKLMEVSCSRNCLSVINMNGAYSLFIFDCESNKITDINTLCIVDGEGDLITDFVNEDNGQNVSVWNSEQRMHVVGINWFSLDAEAHLGDIYELTYAISMISSGQASENTDVETVNTDTASNDAQEQVLTSSETQNASGAAYAPIGEHAASTFETGGRALVWIILCIVSWVIVAIEIGINLKHGKTHIAAKHN